MTVPDILLLAARLSLAAVFVTAAATKLLARDGARRALADFGLPARLTPAGVIALPLAELATALALLARSTARLGALGALGLLVLFVAGVSTSLRRGRRHDCHCFGHLYSKPIGWSTLVRNGALALIAAVVALAGWDDPGPSLVAWLWPLTATERAVAIGGAIGLALLAGQAALLVAILRRVGQLLGRFDAGGGLGPAVQLEAAGGAVETTAAPPAVGLPVGSPAPPFALPDLAGETVALEELRALTRPTVLVFSDPACGACNLLLPDIGRWQRERSGSFTVAIVGRGTPEMNRAKSREYGLARVLLQRDRELLAAYRVRGTPSAVVVRSDGTIGSPLAQGPEEIARLVDGLVTPARPHPLPQAAGYGNGRGDAPPPPASAPVDLAPAAQIGGAPTVAACEGDLAPEFTLPDLDGVPVSLVRFRDASVLLLFWSPTCGHCKRMLDDLRAWAARPRVERSELLIVATGGVEENRAQGLPGTVVLDPSFSVASRYGVLGTPSAVWVDPQGRIAAPVAAGVEAIQELVSESAPVPDLIPTARPRKDDCVEDELLADGSMVLYSGCRQRVLTLNPTAALIWEYCDGEHDLASIVAEVGDVFPAAEVEQDVRRLLGELARVGMVAIAA